LVEKRLVLSFVPFYDGNNLIKGERIKNLVVKTIVYLLLELGGNKKYLDWFECFVVLVPKLIWVSSLLCFVLFFIAKKRTKKG